MKNHGFTLVELIISVSIAMVIILIAGIFVQNVLNFGNIFKDSFEAKSEVNQLSQAIGREVRAATISNTGSYPIENAASSTFTFYSDIEEDGIAERIRYFLDADTLKKGIIRSSGNPPTYNPANEIITEVVHNVILSATSTFGYYDSAYTGSEAPLAFPINASVVRLINVKLTAQNPGQNIAATIDLKLVPRNLRTNL